MENDRNPKILEQDIYILYTVYNYGTVFELNAFDFLLYWYLPSQFFISIMNLFYLQGIEEGSEVLAHCRFLDEYGTCIYR